MTPRQAKVLKALIKGQPESRQELVHRTKLDYHAVHKALVYLMETGRVTSICINKVTHYMPTPDDVVPGETTVQRAIRVRPALHNIFWQGAQQ